MNSEVSVLMYVPCILYGSLSRPTNAQHIYTYIYIYINNILYFLSTFGCFDPLTSSSDLSFYFAKVIKVIKVTNSTKSVD